MRRREPFVKRPVIVACVALSFLTACCFGQASQSRPEPVVRLSVNEVVLDVVVTDKKGRSVRDLTAEDFEVFEDGAVQQILRMRRVDASGAAQLEQGPDKAASAPGAKPFRTDQLPQINMISLIFDRLSLYGRKMARDAAQKYLAKLGPDDLVSVMVIDRRLQILVPYSREKSRIAAAIDLALNGTSQQFADASAQIREASQQSEQATDTAQAGISQVGRASGGPSTGTMQAFAEAEMTEAAASMLRRAASGEQLIQGLATVESLIQVVRGQKSFPGRKAVVFFAETMALPVHVQERFRDLISLANRENVSFYSIDTAGLENGGQLAPMASELERLGGVSRGQMRKRAGAVTQEEVLLAENANNVLTMSSQNALADLAESTGGFLVANTNDLFPGLVQVSEDLRSHYELTYNPTNQVYNGAFRKIEVKLRKPALVVRSREGYYGLPANELAEAPYEIPLLSALEAEAPAADLSFRSASFLFPTAGPRSEVMLYLEAPLTGFQFDVDGKKKEYLARLSLLVTVRNASGRVIEKFSQEFPLSGSADKTAQTRARNFLFYRTVDLPPDRYLVESVVRDAVSGATGVKRAVLIVPRPPAQLKVSSLITVKRLDPAAAEEPLLNSPLSLGTQRIVPYMETTIRPAEWSSTAFYFIVRTLAGGELTADLILSKDGKSIGHMGEKPLPPADARGEIRYLATLPVANLTPGNYDVQVVVRGKESAATSRTVFLLE